MHKNAKITKFRYSEETDIIILVLKAGQKIKSDMLQYAAILFVKILVKKWNYSVIKWLTTNEIT